MKRQYVAVSFGQGRSYTYHNDGEPVAPGDEVEVDARGHKKTATVESVTDVKPPFETKPIIGRAPKTELAL